MKLRDLKDFPKKKSISRSGEWVNKQFNQALDICGEIEVLERLDDGKLAKELYAYSKEDVTWNWCAIFAEEFCKEFGTPKIDDGKIEYILKPYFSHEGKGHLKNVIKAIAKELRGE